MYPNSLGHVGSKRRKLQENRTRTCIATFIRWLATKSDQHNIGKDFGIKQPAVSRRLLRGCRAILAAYQWDGCVDKKVCFPDEIQRRRSSDTFFRITSGIPYLVGVIDGTIIHIKCPDDRTFMPSEFFNPRKGTYGINAMIICDEKKRIIFADPRWPGATNDRGAVARSKF